MPDLTVSLPVVNLEALDAELRAALGSAIAGLSFSRGLLTVHLLAAAPSDAVEAARQIIHRHDPSVLTPAQRQSRELDQRLEAARRERGSDLDPARFAESSLAELARKVAWLEQEMLALRLGR